jgi:ribose 5-phosphate isomerase B
MTIHIATDHAGFNLKEQLKTYVTSLGYTVIDHGTNSSESCDYPDFIIPCSQAVVADETSLGIILGGSGQGEAMCANRIIGIRAVVFYGGNLEIVKLGKEHNNANVLSFGARFVSFDEAKQAIDIFLNDTFSGDERHVRRLAKF